MTKTQQKQFKDKFTAFGNVYADLKELEKFIDSLMSEQKRLILEEGDKMEQKPDNKYDDEQMLRYRQQWKSGYNQALTDYQERIKQLSEEVDHEWENEKVKRANMINL